MASENVTPVSTPNQTLVLDANNVIPNTPKPSTNNSTVKSTFQIFRNENLNPGYHGCVHISTRINNNLMDSYRICCRYSIRFRNKYILKQDLKSKATEAKLSGTTTTSTKKFSEENIFKSLNKVQYILLLLLL